MPGIWRAAAVVERPSTATEHSTTSPSRTSTPATSQTTVRPPSLPPPPSSSSSSSTTSTTHSSSTSTATKPSSENAVSTSTPTPSTPSSPSSPSSEPTPQSTTTSPSSPSNSLPDPSGSASSAVGLKGDAQPTASLATRPKGSNVAAKVVPAVLVPLVLIGILVLFVIRRRRRRYMKAPSYQARATGFTPPTTMRGREEGPYPVSASHVKYTDDSHDDILAPAHAESKASSAADLAASPIDVTASPVIAGPVSKAPWRPEPLPQAPDSDRVSSHSRSPSLAERRTQRLMRALQDAPPLPGTAV